MSIRHRAAAVVAAVTVGLGLLIAGPPASAHNVLVSAEPEPDAELTTSPRRVELVFAQPIDPTFTVIAVQDADGRPVPATQAVEGTRGAVTFGAPLAPGTYTVAYRVSSADGHPVQGAYTFTVLGDPGDDDPGQEASGGAGDAPTQPGGSDDAPAQPGGDADQSEAAGSDPGPGTAPLLLTAGLLVVLLAAGGWLWWRRRAVAS